MRRHYGIPLVVIVRAGVGWSGVGTLAVAVGVGLLLSPPVASPSRSRGASCGRPGGGSAAPPPVASPSRARGASCGRPGGCNVSVRETTYPDECVKTRYRAHRVLFHMFEKTLDLSFVRPMLSWLNPCKHTGTPPPSFT